MLAFRVGHWVGVVVASVGVVVASVVYEMRPIRVRVRVRLLLVWCTR